MKTAFGLLVVLACSAGYSSAQEVVADHGNVELRNTPGAAPRTLTTLGIDSEPALSVDRLWVTFVRGTPGRIVPGATAPVEATELWIVKTDGTNARRLLDGGLDGLGGLSHPQFSPDGRRVYVEGEFAATTHRVRAVDIDGGELHAVCVCSLLEIVTTGEYRGDLVVTKHKYFMAGGSYDWVWLISPTDQEIGPLGEAEYAQAAISAFHLIYPK